MEMKNKEIIDYYGICKICVGKEELDNENLICDSCGKMHKYNYKKVKCSSAIYFFCSKECYNNGLLFLSL